MEHPTAGRAAAEKILVWRRRSRFRTVIGDPGAIIQTHTQHHAFAIEYIDDILPFVVSKLIQHLVVRRVIDVVVLDHTHRLKRKSMMVKRVVLGTLIGNGEFQQVAGPGITRGALVRHLGVVGSAVFKMTNGAIDP